MAPQNGKFITLDIFREGQVHPLSPYHHSELWKHFCESAKILWIWNHLSSVPGGEKHFCPSQPLNSFCMGPANQQYLHYMSDQQLIFQDTEWLPKAFWMFLKFSD